MQNFSPENFRNQSENCRSERAKIPKNHNRNVNGGDYQKEVLTTTPEIVNVYLFPFLSERRLRGSRPVFHEKHTPIYIVKSRNDVECRG